MSSTSAPALFANTILVPWEAGQVPTRQAIGAMDQLRKKRPHQKSRRGCVACKRRRVKVRHYLTIQCDEGLPCSSCVKRNIQCLLPSHQHVITPGLSTPSAHFKMDLNPQISLLHLQLFHHWDKETRSTVIFPEIWPVVMQRAFDEDFIMSAILSVAAMHLTTLCPESTKYSHASAQLMTKTIQLFRKSLSRPLTKENCESLMGTALLINYMSWFDLGFLDDGRTATKLDLAEDQLFLLTPGILQVWLQAMPIFINEGSVFTQIIYQNPRLIIEESLATRGEDPARFVEPFMRMWDDPRYHTSTEMTACGPTSYAWRLLRGMETELSCRRFLPSTAVLISEGHDEKKKLVHFRDAVIKITTKYTSVGQPDTSDTPSSQSARSSFENIIRRMSPLLCCAFLKSISGTEVHPSIKLCGTDIEQLFYGFPIVCCGPFARLIMKGDSRALVFLFHFYRAVRILLAPERCWWAIARSRVMEKLILKELESRELDVSL
ncbi:putative C6 transcription factor [Talaromyces proteolyticus]|uniref:C6 transcription factor n=1 Tax=Talaromyces proteolyticus TaxID=1131652 RepID=A0AAD4KGX1_9EURO|nr:putative C6 transcription factor [Talaromyces proteolyticus]KAH8690828.1 putative C6 transcription factor [Talaromyces proteolyticus]